MTMTLSPTPNRLLAAKTAATATAITAATALTVSMSAPAISAMAMPDPVAIPAALTAPNVVEAEVQLAAMVGLYGVGPVFQALRLVGVDDATELITNAVKLLGQPALTSAVETLLGVLETISPLDLDFVPSFGPAGVYDQVNGLDYSMGMFGPLSGIMDIIQGATGWIPGLGGAIDAVTNNVETLVNQRRAILLSEHFGGTDTAIALNQMIKDVENDSKLWGDDSNGVTGVVTILLRNTSRPGGGLLALATPITELLGIDLSNPEAGSYTNAGSNDGLATKILNVSITDVGFKYDLLSDVPTTLNPLSWANSIAGVILPTYLLPDPDNVLGATGSVIPGLVGGILNAGTVALDPTGGQGAEIITQGTPGGIIGSTVNWIMDTLVGVASGITGVELGMEGVDTYITYDSGNLPLLEPFQLIPRVLAYTGMANISTPFSSSFADALRTMVDVGYTDVVAREGANGVWSFERTANSMAKGAAEQADIFRLPEHLTWGQRFEVPQTLLNNLIDGVQGNLLNPQGQRLSVFGNNAIGDLVYGNVLVVSVAEALSQALEMIREPVNQLFNAGQEMLAPLAAVLDDLTVQVNGLIDQGRDAIKSIGIDLSGPMFDVNRVFNQATDPLVSLLPGVAAGGIGSVVGGLTKGGVGTRSMLSEGGPATDGTDSAARSVSFQDRIEGPLIGGLPPADGLPAVGEVPEEPKDTVTLELESVGTEAVEQPITSEAVTAELNDDAPTAVVDSTAPVALETVETDTEKSTEKVSDEASEGQGNATSKDESALNTSKKTLTEKRAERQAEREDEKESRKGTRNGSNREPIRTDREAKRAERVTQRETKQNSPRMERESKKTERTSTRGERSERKSNRGGGGKSSE